jgi:hypothetical protein
LRPEGIASGLQLPPRVLEGLGVTDEGFLHLLRRDVLKLVGKKRKPLPRPAVAAVSDAGAAVSDKPDDSEKKTGLFSPVPGCALLTFETHIPVRRRPVSCLGQ